MPAAGHADQPDPALLLVCAGGGRDGAFRFPAADRGEHAARAGTGFQLAVLRSGKRGRSFALAASLLALRSPGSLYHLPAIRGDSRHDHPDRRTAADRRLQLDRVGGGGHGIHQLRLVGPPHVYHRPAGSFPRAVLRGIGGGGDSDVRADCSASLPRSPPGGK